jgi:hypothetical protein
MPLLSSWFWLLLALIPLVFLERWIHRHLQGIWLLLLRDADLALVLYSVLMLPGVLLHEGSHWVTATLLGVRTGRFSVMPARMPDGTLRLGYVETEPVDFVREALIGAAPLLFGATAIVLAGYSRLGVGPVGEALGRGDLLGMGRALRAMVDLPDFWLWLYLIFTISNSMLPSASDRRSWWRLFIVLGVIVAGLFYLGFGSALVATLAEPLDSAARALAAAFAITVGLNLCLVPILWLIEAGLARATGMKVQYE